MENRARILLLFVSVALILLLVGSGGFMVAHNAVALTLPGDAWFGMRQFEESLQVFFASDVAARTSVRMNIVAFRLNDLAARTGSPHEIDAVLGLDDAINRALNAIADLPTNKRAAALQQLATWMYGAEDLLATTGLSHDSVFLDRFDQKVSTIRDASEQGMLAPEYLRQLAISLPLPFAFTSINSNAIAIVAPRTVPAPMGFKHSYPLDGAHAKTDCEKCHATGKYEGTPRDCGACHRDVHNNTLGRQCAACHTTQAWKPASKK